jgi:hypothetical protein
MFPLWQKSRTLTGNFIASGCTSVYTNLCWVWGMYHNDESSAVDSNPAQLTKMIQQHSNLFLHRISLHLRYAASVTSIWLYRSWESTFTAFLWRGLDWTRSSWNVQVLSSKEARVMATLQTFIRELPHFNIGQNTDRPTFVICFFSPFSFFSQIPGLGKDLCL